MGHFIVGIKKKIPPLSFIIRRGSRWSLGCEPKSKSLEFEYVQLSQPMLISGKKSRDSPPISALGVRTTRVQHDCQWLCQLQ